MSRARIESLLLQLDTNWHNNEWIVPIYRALDGVSSSEAAWKSPIGESNTIWQIVNHINFYNNQILQQLLNEPQQEHGSNTSTFGSPGDPDDEAGWQEQKSRAFTIADRLRDAISALSDQDLETPIQENTLGFLLSTWVLHDSHHAGQIVLIRKLQASWPVTIWP